MRRPRALLAHAFGDIGLPRLAGPRAVHVNVSRDFLLAVRPLPLDPSRVVLEVDAGEPADDALVAVVREARDAGFRIALDDFRADSGADALLDIADSVKLDVSGAGRGRDRGRRQHRARARPAADRRRRPDARRSTASAAGSASTPSRASTSPSRSIVTGAAVPTYRFRALSMLAAGEATSFEQLERVISEDPGLSA